MCAANFPQKTTTTVCLGFFLHTSSMLHTHSILMLYSQTKGVKQKYILCISGLVVYRQYIHNCSSQVDPHLAHGGESSICSSAPLAWLRLLAGLSYSSPLPRLGSNPQIRNWLASGESILLLSPSAPDHPNGSGMLRTAPTAAGGCWTPPLLLLTADR